MRSHPPFSSRRRRGIAGAAVAGLLAATLVACGTEEPEESPGADDESAAADALVVYAGRDEELLAPLIDQFTEESGIDVEVRYAETPEHAATLLEEGENTPADVFISQDAGALGALAREGMLTDLPEEITGAVLPDYTSTDGSWVGVTGRARVIVYNSEVLDDADVPDTVGAFTDPEWKGRVGFPPGNASFQSFVTGFRVAEGDDAAREWLEQMAANDVQTFESNGDTLAAVDAGTVDVGLINHYYIYGLREEVGAENVTAEMKFPAAGDPGALVNVTGAAILSDHADAEALVSYLVSEEGQAYFVENTYEYPLVEGVPAPEGLPPLADIQGPIEDLSDLDDVEASIEMINEAGLG